MQSRTLTKWTVISALAGGALLLVWCSINYFGQKPLPIINGRSFGVGFIPRGLWLLSVVHERVISLVLPYWLLLCFASVLPVIWLVRWRRQCRQKYRLVNRLCVKCGYDLRSTPERCPECGTPSS